MLYLVQFPAGLTRLVEQALSADLADVQVKFADESAVAFESETEIRSADSMPYAKNVFQVCAEASRRSMSRAIDDLARNLPDLRPSHTGREPGFRIMYHVDGQLVSVDAGLRRSLEQAVGRASGMRLTPRGHCEEFWVIGRRDLPVLYLAERLRGAAAPARTRGSLSRELSALLVSASEPHPDDVFLDPFGGSGALVQARLRSPFRRVVYNDLELEQFRSQFSPDVTRKSVTLLSEDALRLRSVGDESVDVIATDPPWGEHDETISDYRGFVVGLSAAFQRVLRPKVGRAVLLINRRNEQTVADVLAESSMTIYDTFPILVNGHPASVLRAHV